MVLKSKTKKKTNKSKKPELLNLLKENDDFEDKGVNETVKSVNNSQEAIVLIRRNEDIIKTQNKKAIRYIAKKGELLKNFEDTQNFFDNVGQRKSTIYFKFRFISF